MGDFLEEELDRADFLTSKVLAKRGWMRLDQWIEVARPYSLFLDDLDYLRKKAPNVAKLNAKDMSYLAHQVGRYSRALTEEDNRRTFTERQLRRMRLKRISLK